MPHAKSTDGFDRFNEIATIRAEFEDVKPLIWRDVEAPTSVTLKALRGPRGGPRFRFSLGRFRSRLLFCPDPVPSRHAASLARRWLIHSQASLGSQPW